jgi:hypothetical protein
MRRLALASVLLTAACGPKRPPPTFAPDPGLVEQAGCHLQAAECVRRVEPRYLDIALDANLQVARVLRRGLRPQLGFRTARRKQAAVQYRDVQVDSNT